jgi:hypothetical protein
MLNAVKHLGNKLIFSKNRDSSGLKPFRMTEKLDIAALCKVPLSFVFNKNSFVIRDEGLLRGTTLVALLSLFKATSVDAVTGIPVRG